MVTSSSEINKVIRQHFSPLLQQNGFTKVETRLNWGWDSPCTRVLIIRAVGGHFSAVTGWPSMSLGVQLGVWYEFIPQDHPRGVKINPNGKPLPQDYECQQRHHLDIGLDQNRYTQQLTNPAEQSRTDLWWVQPDGSNVEEVVKDIGQQFLVAGRPWFQHMTDIPTVFADVKEQHNCYDKFRKAACYAKYLGHDDEYQEYRLKLEQEVHRIGRPEYLAFCP